MIKLIKQRIDKALHNANLSHWCLIYWGIHGCRFLRSDNSHLIIDHYPIDIIDRLRDFDKRRELS